MENHLKPPIATLVKIGSLVVHAEEFMSPTGHEFDKTAFKTLITDPDVVAWIASMTKAGFLPVKR